MSWKATPGWYRHPEHNGTNLGILAVRRGGNRGRHLRHRRGGYWVRYRGTSADLISNLTWVTHLPTHLPEGIVTFLFTDVEGSTRLWEDAPDTMMDAIRQHDVTIDPNRG